MLSVEVGDDHDVSLPWGTVKEPTPKRSRSLWAMPMDIISMAQHARPNCSGHSEFFRAQLNSLSVLVVIVLGSLYCSLHLFERPFHPGVDEPYGQDRDEMTISTTPRWTSIVV